MRKTLCRGLLLSSGAMFGVVAVNKGLLNQILMLAAMAVGLYVVLRFVRWLMGKVAPLIRWVAVLAFVGGMVLMAGREVQARGADSVLVLAILFLFMWAVLCPSNPKRARA